MKYQWNHADTTVAEIRFSARDTKSVNEAVILLNPIDVVEGDTIDIALTDRGYSVNYDIIDGKSALRVTGYRQDQELLSFLEKQSFTNGTPARHETPKSDSSYAAKIKESSLVLSAAFYMLGNISAALSGWFRRDMDELKTGLSFSVGDSFMLLFGKKSQKEKYQDMMQGFGEMLKTNGYAPAFGSSFSPTAIKEGTESGRKTRKFLQNMVIPVKSVSEIFAGYSFAKAGFNQNNPYKKFAGGALIAGFSTGLLTPEKNSSDLREEFGVETDEEVKTKIAEMPFWKRLKYKIERSPLVVPGTLAGMNNLATIGSALDERRGIKQSTDKESSQLKEVKAQLYGGKYKPSFFQAEKTITTQDSVRGKIKTYYQEIAELNSQLDAVKDDPDKLDEQGKLLGKLNYKKSENAKLLDEEAKLWEQEKALTYGRSIKLFGKELKADQSNFWVFNLAQGLFFLIANSLYSISSKNGGSGSQEMTDRFVSSLASEVLLTPSENRAEIIALGAHYMGKQKEINLTTAEAYDLIEAKVAQLQSHNLIVFEVDDEKVIEAAVEKANEMEAAKKEEKAVGEKETKQEEIAESKSDKSAPQDVPSESKKSYAERIKPKSVDNKIREALTQSKLHHSFEEEHKRKPPGTDPVDEVGVQL